jgi:hypothetical protein
MSVPKWTYQFLARQGVTGADVCRVDYLRRGIRAYRRLWGQQYFGISAYETNTNESRKGAFAAHLNDEVAKMSQKPAKCQRLLRDIRRNFPIGRWTPP